MGFAVSPAGTTQSCPGVLDCVDDLQVFYRVMSLYNRLLKEKKRLGKKALRFPKTTQELLDRNRWERIYLILTRRYEYDIEDAMDNYRRQDQIEEIATIKRTE